MGAYSGTLQVSRRTVYKAASRHSRTVQGVSSPARFGDTFKDEALAREFVNGVRNGIFHEAEQGSGSSGEMSRPGAIVEKKQDGFALNRTLFYHVTKEEFESYLQELRRPSNSALRQRFKKKMNDIVKET